MIKLSSCAFAASAIALVALAGCTREADKASRSLAEDTTATAAAPARTERVSNRYDDQRPAYQDRRSSRRPESGGDLAWATSRRGSAEENARRQFERNGADFGAQTLEAYVEKARVFAASPPRGVLTAARTNGDKLYYDPRSNTFLVTDRRGAPRTMFKPREGRAYWTQQQVRLDDSASSSSGRRRSDAGGGEDAAG